MAEKRIDTIHIGNDDFVFTLRDDTELTVKKLTVTSPQYTYTISGKYLVIKQNY